MYRVDQLILRPEVPEEIQKLANDLVGYVMNKKTKKVVDVAIIRRAAIPDWYSGRKIKFPEEEHIFCISATSIVGVVLGMQTTEVESRPKDDDDGSDPKGGKKTQYNYHVN